MFNLFVLAFVVSIRFVYRKKANNPKNHVIIFFTIGITSVFYFLGTLRIQKKDLLEYKFTDK